MLPLLLVTRPGHAPIVYAVAAAHSALAALFAAAEAALVPALVDKSSLITANALNGQARDVARLVGAASGGILAAAGGIRLIAVADTATFVAAVVLLGFLRHRSHPVRTHAPSLLREWREGTRIALASRTLRVLLAFAVITGIGESVMMTLMAPFVRDVLHGGPSAYGTIMSVQAIGGLTGGFVATLIGHRFTPRLLLGGGAVIFGLLDLALFLYPLLLPALWPAVVIMILVGLPGALMVAGLMTSFQTATDDSHRGRVFGALTALIAAAMLTGTAAAGFLAGHAGIVAVIAVQGAAHCLAGALVLIALPAGAPAPRTESPEPTTARS